MALLFNELLLRALERDKGFRPWNWMTSVFLRHL